MTVMAEPFSRLVPEAVGTGQLREFRPPPEEERGK
jgi:hypothetical protein